MEIIILYFILNAIIALRHEIVFTRENKEDTFNFYFYTILVGFPVVLFMGIKSLFKD